MNNDECITEVVESPKNKPEALSPYWFWKNGISDALIECFNDEIKDIPPEKGTTVSTKYGKQNDDAVRNSDILIFDPIHWFAGILFNYAISSNYQAGWEIETTVPQSLQVAHYGPSQHYTWHSDTEMFVKEKIIRKLSVICLLSDRSEFEGGELELAGVGQIEFNKGDVIVFPSILQHRVVPVTSGFRKSSTLWILGNRRW